MSAYVAKERIKKDFPQVQHAVYVQDNEPVFLKDGQATATKNWLFADDDFLEVRAACRSLAGDARADRSADRGDHAGRSDQAAMEPTRSSAAR